jgi:hypothetical protein
VYKVVDVWLACEPEFGGDAGGDEPAIGCGGARLGQRVRVFLFFFFFEWRECEAWVGMSLLHDDRRCLQRR